MTEEADERSTTAAARATMSRRQVLGLGAAVVLSSRATLEARVSPGSARINNRGSIVEISSRPHGAVTLSSFRNAATQFEWVTPSAFAPTFEYSKGASLSWRSLAAESGRDRITLRASSRDHVEARMEFTAYADTGAFRCQQHFLNAGESIIPAVTRISAIDLALRPDLDRLIVHCVRRDGDYTREALPFRSQLEIQGGDWNAPVYTGLIVIEAVGRSELLIIGVEQERGWTFSLERRPDSLRLRVALEHMEKNVAPHTTLAACPVFLGACGGDLDAAVNLVLEHLRKRILPAPLPGAPWVSYNIWSTDADNVEKNILGEIPFAAGMGVDLFYLDASWYKGSSKRGNGDWGKGLGSYVEDRSKFPHGLRYLSDRVHAAGMKFGLWVGPNIVDETLVPDEIPASWLALADGKRAELKVPTWQNPCVQVCLGSTGYAEHLKQSLTRLVEDYNLDWLKWDNSGIPALPARCNRGDHGHAPGDGSACALQNEYEIFEHLHRKFPHLAIEQCGYGSRLDYGLARTIRANWCSDTCYPASRLRSNSLVCATVYPSAYNAAWIVREDTELFAAKTRAVVDASIRSRMIGLFGVGTLNGQMTQRVSLYPKNILDRLAVHVKLYKRFRHLLFQQVSFPYEPYGTDPQGWQAVQFTSLDASEAVVLCFRGSSTQTVSQLSLGRLHPSRSYRARFIDGGTVSTMSGKEMMDTGIYLSLPEAGASEIVLIEEVIARRAE
jgi:alpha-galactosidase